MSVVMQIFPEDLTGTRPENLIQGELKTLSNRPIRVAVPRYGPFFTETLRVYDNANNRPLVLGIDYVFPMISKEASLRTGKELAEAIIILNPDVSGTILYNYQTIGGMFQNNVANLASLYEAFMNDTRAVDWVTGVLGKPSEFPPAPHPHYLSEIYHFEPIIFQLERIHAALLIGQTPAVDLVLESILKNFATVQETLSAIPLNKAVSIAGLLAAMKKFQANQYHFGSEDTDQFVIKPNGELTIQVYSDVNLDGEVYLWSFRHLVSVPANFNINSGTMTFNKHTAQFTVMTSGLPTGRLPDALTVRLFLDDINGMAISESKPLKLLKHSVNTW